MYFFLFYHLDFILISISDYHIIFCVQFVSAFEDIAKEVGDAGLTAIYGNAGIDIATEGKVLVFFKQIFLNRKLAGFDQTFLLKSVS